MFPEHIPEKKTEPEMHPAVRKSFLYMPTAGMRIAPEILVLELFRELFFESFCGGGTARQLDPEDDGADYDELEKGVLYACRTSKRQFSQTKVDSYYAPAYPGLARNAWLRKQSDRVIRDYLFAALSQKLNAGANKPKDKELFSTFRDQLFQALIGKHSFDQDDSQKKDIFSVACSTKHASKYQRSHFKPIYDGKLEELLDESGLIDYQGDEGDLLAERITRDFLNVCKLESRLPRLQWLEVLKAFLRLSIPIWLLSHARITCLVRNWLCDVLNGKGFPSAKDISSAINKRHAGLIIPSVTPTNSIAIQVENYMRARVELNVLLYGLDSLAEDGIKGRTLSVSSKGSDKLTLGQLLQLATGRRGDFLRSCCVEEGDDIRSHLTRRCEGYAAWKNPLKKGNQGSNFDEFLRVLRKAHVGDDEGSFLLNPSKATGGQYFTVFPGFMMLKLVAYLASCEQERTTIMLSDLEEHLGQYGIDFSASEGARPMLLQCLREIGILGGSPDAGESVEIINPYLGAVV